MVWFGLISPYDRVVVVKILKTWEGAGFKDRYGRDMGASGSTLIVLSNQFNGWSARLPASEAAKIDWAGIQPDDFGRLLQYQLQNN